MMTGDEIVIAVDQLSKRYLIGHRSTDGRETFREMLSRRSIGIARGLRDIANRRQTRGEEEIEEFWALKDISFDVRRGEVMGVVGRNGAGKSTLLKVLSRITEPTQGRVTIRGRIASLLEVGTGFHPELTGRENIFLNGAILGMTRREVNTKFDEIVDFAGVERFLDTPVKRYSSGMYVRLAFAVAAHLEPDILIIDEVLAVGDVVFQKKCLGKMQNVASSGRTVLFVSHNMQAVVGLTDRCILLEGGQVVAVGPSEDVIYRYLGMHTSTNQIYEANLQSDEPHLMRVAIRPSGPGQVQGHGKPMAIDIDIYTPHLIQNAAVSFQIFTMMHQPVLHVLHLDLEAPILREPGIHRLTCQIPKVRLFPGHYYLSFYFGAVDPRREYIAPKEVLSFEVVLLDQVRDFYWAPNSALYVEESNWIVTPSAISTVAN
jgi:lipopolysaccharide transport system ATP-binding protein